MKKFVLLSCYLLLFIPLFAQDWSVVKGKILTPWAEKVNPAAPLPEYPRPQLVRGNWMNLNGMWQYNILPKTQETIPSSWSGRILVPFAVESALSGVGKSVGKDSVLWYEKTVTIPAAYSKGKVLLHFGA